MRSRPRRGRPDAGGRAVGLPGALSDDVAIAQQVLMPAAADESNGVEDARFTRFVDTGGVVDYRATYTATTGSGSRPAC